MTVIDEEVGSAEYSDMEFVEFLEFLVRIAFITTKKEIPPDAKIIEKLRYFL